MKITGARLSRVRYPLGGAKATAHNVVSEHHRTIIRLDGEGGLTGLGECSGHPDSWRLAGVIARQVLGHDPAEIGPFRHAFARMNFHQRNGRNGWIAYGGIETACFDLLGQAVGRPLYDLLGGRCRERIQVVKGLGAVPLEAGATRADVEAFMDDLGNVDQVVAAAQTALAGTGIGTLKIKSAAHRPEWDFRVLTALREAFGRSLKLRLDPNAGYTPAQAFSLFRRLDPLGLEFFEDPTADLEGMARLRRQVRTPLATNMCVIQFEQLPPAIRLGAVDLVLGDVYHWGGLLAVRDLIAVCTAFGLGVGIHSTLESEWDIGVACNLHIAAAFPAVETAIDGHFPAAAGGIVQTPLEVREGAITVPDGPGLGITLDEAKLEPLTIDRFAASL